MKSLTGLVFAVMLVFAFSIVTSPAFAANQPVVGVKEGHWIEYDISITGTGTPPPTHDVRWMRFQVLLVDGAALSVNLTVRYANGTFGSAIWEYNFTEGNLGGWTIIPANLNPGDTFYDASEHNHKPVNVTVQGQEQRTVLGAIRTVTYGNDSLRHSKEWDKATGVFIGSSEVVQNVTNKDGWYIENLTVTTRAVATNLWSPQNRQILGMEQSVYALGSRRSSVWISDGIFGGCCFPATEAKTPLLAGSPIWKKSVHWGTDCLAGASGGCRRNLVFLG